MAATSFGLLGEGVLPYPYLSRVSSVGKIVADYQDRTVVLMRSKSKGTSDVSEEWLPDTFIAQLLCNSKALTVAGLEDKTVGVMSFLEMLSVFVGANRGATGNGVVMIDGTSVLKPMFDAGSETPLSTSEGNTAGENGSTLYLGTLGLVLVLDVIEGYSNEQLSKVQVVEAPWPPVYVLETVAAPTGIVLVNSVNCGYLDFAMNLLRSVRNVSEAKILWVAMDEVTFDFMDAAAPGCAVIYPYEDSERHHAIKAGSFKDDIFRDQVLVRPMILLNILKQGYTLLWTDSDMVWLRDPLPLLPDLNDPTAAGLMLQYDGSEENKCTCLLFMKPHKLVMKLLESWAQAIVDKHPAQDQVVFRGPWSIMTREGLRTDVFPEKLFPAGEVFFYLPWEENYTQKYFPDIFIVHNNFMKGHDNKVARFKAYQFWGVDDISFPMCER